VSFQFKAQVKLKAGAQGGGELEEDMVAVDEVLESLRVQGGYEALVA
jgi:hypothetical protein